MQLPRWSAHADTGITPCPRPNEFVISKTGEKSSSDKTTIMKSENVTNTAYQSHNGFEKAYETASDIDKNVNIFDVNDPRQNVDEQIISQHSENENLSVEGNEVKITAVLDVPKEDSSLHYSENVVKSENLRLANSDNDMTKQDSGTISESSHKTDTGVQLFFNVSNFKSNESNSETARACSRHIVEPVAEKVRVEVLQMDKVLEIGDNSPEMDDTSNSHAVSTCDSLLRFLIISSKYPKIS